MERGGGLRVLHVGGSQVISPYGAGTPTSDTSSMLHAWPGEICGTVAGRRRRETKQ